MRFLPKGINDASFIAAWVCILLPFLALWAMRVKRGRDTGDSLGPSWRRRLPTVLLLGMATLTTLVYVDRGDRRNRHNVMGYDTFHYYPGAKYRQELGTELLYVCSLLADMEFDKTGFGKLNRYRDLKTYKVRRFNKRNVRRDGRECKKRFTPARWKEFKKDLKYFQKVTPRKTWPRIFVDRGTNASPIWHLFGGAVARMVPSHQLQWATRLDGLMLAVAVGFIFWAFGLEVALITIVFLTACLSTRWPDIGSALFRYDWVAALGIMLALAKKERWALAGAMLAYAAGVRLFPIIVVGGLGGRALWRLATERRLLPKEWRLLGGFMAASAVLWTAAAIDGGVPAIKEFAGKISTHAAPQNVSVMRVGLPIALAWKGEITAKQYGGYKSGLKVKRVIIKGQAPYHRGFVLFLILLVIGITRRVNDEEAWLIGWAMFPLCLQASYYYYVFLIVPFVLLSAHLTRRFYYGLFAGLCLINAAGHLALGNRLTRYIVLAPGSVVICIWAVLCIGILAWWSHRRFALGLADDGLPLPAGDPQVEDEPPADAGDGADLDADVSAAPVEGDGPQD